MHSAGHMVVKLLIIKSSNIWIWGDSCNLNQRGNLTYWMIQQSNFTHCGGKYYSIDRKERDAESIVGDKANEIINGYRGVINSWNEIDS